MFVSTSRRSLLLGTGAIALASSLPAFAMEAKPVVKSKAKPLPLADVELLPSPYATAVQVNERYLMALSPDRLLHNFRKYAGLDPKAEIYGGWESDTIAGHTLGHYMSALALTHRQTGNDEALRRLNYIVDELATCQAANGDGYIGALGRKRKDGQVVDGKEIWAEVQAGDIRSSGFDLNGSWSPLYTVHKLFAGLLDAHELGNEKALAVLLPLGAYFERVFAALDDTQMETLLGCEYGGLNESYAEMYARTSDRRWLTVAERLYDRRVLDPLVAQQDKLANFHANTQVPKLIGLGRIHELTGDPNKGQAARYFWERVTGHHSYVIGGNADREYFSEPDSISRHITEQTCEHCNTYNMLKLTRMLYSWEPNAALFDFYERAHLNHVLSQIHPRTAGYTYMTPLMSGTSRGYSQPGEDAFWCCVGSGMEVHAKHGESIFWEQDGGLVVNLYIPSELDWKAKRARLKLETDYPYKGEVRLSMEQLRKASTFPVSLRVPGWAADAAITVNGKPAEVTQAGGYATVDRRWQEGDELVLTLPMDLRTESTPDDPKTIAILSGPMVLAADLGPGGEEFYDKAAPALVGANLLAAFKPLAPEQGIYKAVGIARPEDLQFVPFYSQYDRRSAVYFKHFSDAEWKVEEAAFLAEQARQRDLAARSVDVMHLGEMQPERDHDLTSEISYVGAYRGRNSRDARSGGFFQFRMKVKPGPLVLQATYWGEERPKTFDILVDGKVIATETLEARHPGEFYDVEYPVPEALTRGKQSVIVRFQPKEGGRAGPVFGVRLFTAAPAAKSKSA